MRRPRVLVLIFLAIVVISQALDTAPAQEDDVPPAIGNIEFGLIGETWFEIGWETSEPALGGVEWGVASEMDNVQMEAGDEPITQHYLTVTGLRKGTDHTVRIFAKDEHNNTGYSGTFTVGTYPIGWEERLWSNYGWFIILVVLYIIVLMTVIVWNRSRAGRAGR